MGMIAPARAPRVFLTIDRMVLRGFAPEDGRRVLAEFRTELGRMLAAAPQGNFGDSRSISALKVPGTAAKGARGIGVWSAQQLMKGLRR